MSSLARSTRPVSAVTVCLVPVTLLMLVAMGLFITGVPRPGAKDRAAIGDVLVKMFPELPE